LSMWGSATPLDSPHAQMHSTGNSDFSAMRELDSTH
jgi:hypothetical protein